MAKICKILIITLVFEKNANFFAENCQKSQKIVIITSTPDWANFRLSGGCFLLGSFFENFRSSTKTWATFLRGTSCVFIVTKTGLGRTLGDFFENSSGHSGLESYHGARGNRYRHTPVFCSRVARWFIFKPKMPIWVNF
jgi:hypothetical protein